MLPGWHDRGLPPSLWFLTRVMSHVSLGLGFGFKAWGSEGVGRKEPE